MTRGRVAQLLGRLLPGVFLPEDVAAGRRRSEWSKEYWRWAKSFPQGKGPADDPDGALCSQNQSGPLWFLTGSSGTAPIRRKCQILAPVHGLFPSYNFQG